jgi:hypothetical protein
VLSLTAITSNHLMLRPLAPSWRSFTSAHALAVVTQRIAPAWKRARCYAGKGCTTSTSKEWTAARDAQIDPKLEGSAKDRGEVERLRAQNVRLTAQLTQTRTALDIMGKAPVLMEMPPSTGTSTAPRRS